MAKKKYYAVAKGKTPGIYLTWEDCKMQVEHFPGPCYKGFMTIEEAEAFLEEYGAVSDNAEIPRGKDSKENTQPVSSDECLIAYVDGSYDDTIKKYAYGCVLVFEDKEITLNGSGNDEDYISMRNVAGEILGSECAIHWAREHGYSKVVIYYDYEGIEKWANNIWKANKPGTIRYKEFVKEQREFLEICFQKVAAHTGDTYNEMADQLAKKAITPRT